MLSLGCLIDDIDIDSTGMKPSLGIVQVKQFADRLLLNWLHLSPLGCSVLFGLLVREEGFLHQHLLFALDLLDLLLQLFPCFLVLALTLDSLNASLLGVQLIVKLLLHTFDLSLLLSQVGKLGRPVRLSCEFQLLLPLHLEIFD